MSRREERAGEVLAQHELAERAARWSIRCTTPEGAVPINALDVSRDVAERMLLDFLFAHPVPMGRGEFLRVELQPYSRYLP